MLSNKEFEIIKVLSRNSYTGNDLPTFVFENVQYTLFESKNEVFELVCSLREKDILNNNELTTKAYEELNKHKVENAIILAAGGASQSSKSLYSLPKGLYEINGETLIERQIKQLKEAGIDDITVVLGYRQELFLFLERKYNVKLCCTPAIEKGNVVSLSSVKDKLSRTYICSSDNYFVDNPFYKYEYESFHAVVNKKDCIHEVQVKINDNNNIEGCFTAKGAGTCFYGHAFIDENFSNKLVNYLTEELDVFRVDMMFWEELAMRHIYELNWKARHYSDHFLYEFDSISEIQGVETLFIDDVSEKMINRICEILKCEKDSIHNIVVLDKGMTNILLTFMIGNEKYIFRYPGESSWELTSKKREVIAQNLAIQLGLDKSCIYIDESGCKISKYRNNTEDLSQRWWNDEELVCSCAKMMKKLHDNTNLTDLSEMKFDPIAEGDRLMKLASARKGNLLNVFGEIREKALALKEKYSFDNWKEVICHHDWKYDNILYGEGYFDIIDWEYGSLNDPGADLLRLLMGRDYDGDFFNNILDSYFGHRTEKNEKMHVIAAFVPMCYYWLGWLMYQESLGNNGFYWTILYYETALKAIDYTKYYYELG